MKKIFVLLFGLLSASQVFAQVNVCVNGVPNPAPPAAAWVVTPGNFVVRSFPIRCSANVQAVARENTIAFAVGAVSLKGNNKFQGSTGGGQLSGQLCADPKVCVAADADSGLAAILNAAT